MLHQTSSNLWPVYMFVTSHCFVLHNKNIHTRHIKHYILNHHHHHHHVHEGLGVFPVPLSSRWSWSLHLFLGRPMFLRPFGLFNLYLKADMVSGVIQMLICKTHKYWENQPRQQRRLCRQILLPRPRRLRPRDPWAMQLKLQQTGEGAGESPAP